MKNLEDETQSYISDINCPACIWITSYQSAIRLGHDNKYSIGYANWILEKYKSGFLAEFLHE